MMAKSRLFIGIILLGIMTILGDGCSQQPTPPPTPSVTYSIPGLKYLLISNFDPVFYVDPDFYPIAREGQEEKNALEQFNTIKADTIALEPAGMPFQLKLGEFQFIQPEVPSITHLS